MVRFAAPNALIDDASFSPILLSPLTLNKSSFKFVPDEKEDYLPSSLPLSPPTSSYSKDKKSKFKSKSFSIFDPIPPIQQAKNQKSFANFNLELNEHVSMTRRISQRINKIKELTLKEEIKEIQNQFTDYLNISRISSSSLKSFDYLERSKKSENISKIQKLLNHLKLINEQSMEKEAELASTCKIKSDIPVPVPQFSQSFSSIAPIATFPSTSIPSGISSISLQKNSEFDSFISTFEGLKSQSKSFQDSFQSILNDPKWNSHRLELKMFLNRKVGQVTTELRQIIRIILEITRFYDAQWRQFGQEMVNLALQITVSKIIAQAETLIASRIESCFPLGQLCREISMTRPEFLHLLMVELMKKCFLLIPTFENTENEGKDLLQNGRKKESKLESEQESEQEYLDKQCGFIALFGAIIISKPIKTSNHSEIYNSTYGLKWLNQLIDLFVLNSSFISLSKSSLSSSNSSLIKVKSMIGLGIATFLEISGFGIWKDYGQSFIETTIKNIKNKIIPNLSVDRPQHVAYKTRLSLHVDQILESNSIKEPIESKFVK